MSDTLKVIGDSGAFHQPKPLATREDWRLKVWQGPRDQGGTLLAEFSLDALQDLENIELSLQIQCVSADYIAGKGQSVSFGGVRFSKLVETVFPAGIPQDLRTVRFISLAPAACGPKDEKHWTSLPLGVCRQEENGVELAFSMHGAPLPYDHGGPLRGVVGPRLFFYKAVKWLDTIEFVTEPIDECRGTWEEYAGYHNLGWAGRERFEPRMRVIDRVTKEDGDKSTLVPPEDWGATIKLMLERRDFSRLIAARLNKMGLELPKSYTKDFRFTQGDFKAKIRGTSFSGHKFHGAQLAGCNFSLSYFTNAEFSRQGEDPADLRNCDFEGARFENAWLQNVSMQGSYLTNTTFTKDYERRSERVKGLDVRNTINLAEQTKDWLHRSGAQVE